MVWHIGRDRGDRSGSNIADSPSSCQTLNIVYISLYDFVGRNTHLSVAAQCGIQIQGEYCETDCSPHGTENLLTSLLFAGFY